MDDGRDIGCSVAAFSVIRTHTRPCHFRIGIPAVVQNTASVITVKYIASMLQYVDGTTPED